MPSMTSAPHCFNYTADTIAEFVSQLDGKVRSFEGHEQRVHPRYVVAIPSMGCPMDEHFSPQGEAFLTVTRDISVGGINLIHHEPILAKYLAVTLSPPHGPRLELLVRVLRCRSLGNFYDIAGEFVFASE